MPQLEFREGFAQELIDVPAFELWRHLHGPTLFRVPGRAEAPLLVCVLLHGNEDTGWQAVQRVLKEHAGRPLQRSLLLFVGNVEAARQRVRSLPGQIDYNRAWPGTPYHHSVEAELMRHVVEVVKRERPFASIDLHNNTGSNPHYGCTNRLDEHSLHLARLFSRTVVYFSKPAGVQSAALADICPAVTVECGRVNGASGVAHAAQFLAAALAMSHFPENPVPDHDLDLMQTFAIVKVPENATLSFDGSDADFLFRADLDHLNFSELNAGTIFGALGGIGQHRLEVHPGGDFAHTDDYFAYDGGSILLKRPAIPSMLTLDQRAIRLDCLGYLMHRIGRDGRRVPD